MKNIIILILLMTCFNYLNAQPLTTFNIVPQPQTIQMKSGSFLLDNSVAIQASQTDLDSLANYTIHQLAERAAVKISKNKKASKKILFSIEKNNNLLSDEGYIFEISADQIKITANNPKGVFYGVQTFLQTIPFKGKKEIPCMFVKDEPRFAWRGMMLDVSRHFFTVREVKDFLDVMATYKLNVFHWHLSDDQGWRLEIKRYPKLTSIGAWRMEQPSAVFFHKDSTLTEPEKKYGGFYTQQQAKEIVAYAKERNITVIPEFDMPGHSEAALAAYPQFSCRQQPQIVTNAYGPPEGSSDNFCPGNESTFGFLQDILTEVMQIFPSKYVHIGGDEVNKKEWKNDPRCQALIKANNLINEEGLQSYFIHRLAAFLKLHGKTIIGWDETLEGGLAPDAIVQSWRGTKGGIAAAKLKHDVIMSPSSPIYFNRYQGDPKTEPLAAKWSINTLQKVYEFEPVPTQLDSTEQKFVIGSEGGIWTEFFKTNSYLQYMLLPRMLALSELTWSSVKNKNWNVFKDKLPYHFQLFEQNKWNYDRKDVGYEFTK